MCTDADCNFVISGDASKSCFHIWPMLHVCLFVCLKEQRKNKKKKKTWVRLASSWLFIIYKKFPEKPFEK